MKRRNYNPSVLTDTKIPDDTRMISSISLKKETFQSIDSIMKSTPVLYPSKGKVIDEAVKAFVKINPDLIREG